VPISERDYEGGSTCQMVFVMRWHFEDLIKRAEDEHVVVGRVQRDGPVEGPKLGGSLLQLRLDLCD